jgi:hypothetical protein
MKSGVRWAGWRESLQLGAFGDDAMRMDRRPALLPFVAWLLVGITVAGTVQLLRAEAMGGPEGLLFAGELEPAHVVVAREIPTAPIETAHGHDGQIFYAIGVDPAAIDTPGDIVPPYRFRRILYPALSSVFGTLSGTALLWGMIAVVVISTGLAAGAVGGLSSQRSLPFVAPLAVVLNPGVWLSAMFLTADSLALAFGLLGLWAFANNRDGWAWLALAAAALTKETHLVFAFSLAGYLFTSGERRRALTYLVVPTIPLAAWLAYIAFRVGNPLVSGDNLGLPFEGVIASLRLWPANTGVENFFTGVTLLGALTAITVIVRRLRLGTWLVIPWLLLGLLSSHYVWDLGNNSIRTLAPLFTLAVLGSIPGLESPPSHSSGVAQA